MCKRHSDKNNDSTVEVEGDLPWTEKIKEVDHASQISQQLLCLLHAHYQVQQRLELFLNTPT